MKARPCGHVYSKASAMAYFKGVGQRCAVFGCDKHLKWSDFVVDEASEGALAEEATIVLFRNPETTGFGALCQRIAASTTEVPRREPSPGVGGRV